MSIGKIAIALAVLVIIGLLIIGLIKFVIPGAFTYVGCAIGAILTPDASNGVSTSTLSTCATELKSSIKFT